MSCTQNSCNLWVVGGIHKWSWPVCLGLWPIDRPAHSTLAGPAKFQGSTTLCVPGCRSASSRSKKEKTQIGGAVNCNLLVPATNGKSVELSRPSREICDPESQRERHRRRDRDRQSGVQTPKSSESERCRERAAGKERQGTGQRRRERFGVSHVQTSSSRLSRLKLHNSFVFPSPNTFGSRRSHGVAERRNACQLPC